MLKAPIYLLKLYGRLGPAFEKTILNSMLLFNAFYSTILDTFYTECTCLNQGACSFYRFFKKFIRRKMLQIQRLNAVIRNFAIKTLIFLIQNSDVDSLDISRECHNIYLYCTMYEAWGEKIRNLLSLHPFLSVMADC